ncbi:hypothetical protein FRC02_001928 [Tulasnella sp. 418]|nr:hypothetical protein FRC02_001928 [Tulasnella sp. 418]
MPHLTLHDFTRLWRQFFDPTMSFFHFLSIFVQLCLITPLIHLHQRQLLTRNRTTAWLTEARVLIGRALENVTPYYRGELEVDVPDQHRVDAFIQQLPEVMENLDFVDAAPSDVADTLRNATAFQPLLLITKRQDCLLCENEQDGQRNRRLEKKRSQDITVIDRAYTCIAGRLIVAKCMGCSAEYLPDRILIKQGDEKRQFYIYDAEYLRISKSASIWVHRSIGIAQAQKILQRQTISGYSAWFNKTHGPHGFSTSFTPLYGTQPQHLLTTEQSWRLFVEHMIRVIGTASGYPNTFETMQDPDAKELVKEANRWFVRDGVLPNAKAHTCEKCTHPKRYGQAEAGRAGAFEVVGVDDNELDGLLPQENEQVLFMQAPQADMAVEDRQEVVQMAVLDGIVTGHRVCNAPVDPRCRNAPVDFKSARFCDEHRQFLRVCGLVGCDRPAVHGTKACNIPSHACFYQDWLKRFARSSIQSVQRHMERRAETVRQNQEGVIGGGNAAPLVPVELPPLPTLPEDDPLMQRGNNTTRIQHTFQADRVYCVELISWACGMPIAFAKFYTSESESQVYQFLNSVWPEDEAHLRPQYAAYDRSCFLLRHIITSHLHSTWLRTTRFIVDVWHYIGHRADDVLCRTYCNPAPSDGSQPDLIVEEEDEDGNRVH